MTSPSFAHPRAVLWEVTALCHTEPCQPCSSPCEQPSAWQLKLDVMPHSRENLSLGWQHHAVAGDTCATKL